MKNIFISFLSEKHWNKTIRGRLVFVINFIISIIKISSIENYTKNDKYCIINTKNSLLEGSNFISLIYIM